MPKKKPTNSLSKPENTAQQPDVYKIGRKPKEYEEAGIFKKILWRIIDGISLGI